MSMCQSYDTAAPKQLHATLPGPNGTHACLTLYDVCPHTSHTTTLSRSRYPYLQCDLPSPPPASTPQTIEYTHKDGTRIVETRRSMLAPLANPRIPQALDYTNLTPDPYRYSRFSSPRHPQEKAMAASLAPLILSKHSPTMHHIRSSTSTPPRSILRPTLPTVYLVTFSTERTPTTKNFARLLNDHLPPAVPLRYTIDARRFSVPSREVQELYSGISNIVQEHVMRDAGARREVEHAVAELGGFLRTGGRETCIAVCCTAGTHRSVAIAECVARGVRREVRAWGTGGAVKIVVRHVHRVRGLRDAY